MMAREFNPSNKPEPCLYCGTKLRYSVFKERTYTRTVTLCCQAGIEWNYRPSFGGSYRQCATCHREITGQDDTEQVTETVPESRSKIPGRAGLFCTIDCGFSFGCLAAEKGVRYVRKEGS